MKNMLRKLNTEKKYWLVMEPYVFIFKGENEYTLYNSLSFDILNIDAKNKIITNLLDELLKIDNLYSISISEEALCNKKVVNFIDSLRNNFLGDLFSTNLFPTKPAIIPPIINIKNSIENLQKDVELQSKNTYMNFLNEISVYLNGKCSNRCENCNNYFHQTFFCSKSNLEFEKKDIDKIFSIIEEYGILRINILGGNIFLYKYLDYTLNKLNSIDIDKHIYINVKNINIESLNSLYKINNIHINLLFDLNQKINFSIFDSLPMYNEQLNFIFLVTNEKNMSKTYKIIEYYCIKNYKIIPFYNNNIDFFENFVFHSSEDIISSRLSAKNIFTKQSINHYYYGKFIITSDKKIYSDINSNFIGTINDNILDLIKNELNTNSSWFKTRNKLDICKSCSYQFICPSPSAYEQVIGKPNLCHINK